MFGDSRVAGVGLGVCLLIGMVSGCSSGAFGPSVLVLPKRGSTLEAFTVDDDRCRSFADARSEKRGSARESAAIVGSKMLAWGGIGAGLGGLFDGWRGALRGAAVGAGLGALTGGGGSAVAAQGGVQSSYDNAYQQCMYVSGYRIPAAALTGGEELAPKRETLQIGVSRR